MSGKDHVEAAATILGPGLVTMRPTGRWILRSLAFLLELLKQAEEIGNLVIVQDAWLAPRQLNVQVVWTWPWFGDWFAGLDGGVKRWLEGRWGQVDEVIIDLDRFFEKGRHVQCERP